MIQNKNDYLYYLECDKIALKINRKSPRILGGDEVWVYQRLLRKAEYYTNCKPYSPLAYYYRRKLQRLSNRWGVYIPINVCDAGLSIAHLGPIHINSNSKIGENFRIQTGVTLGATDGLPDAPEIGNNVFLGEGCKIIGGVKIADDCQIAANAVVVKDILEKGTTWGGVPAKKISDSNSSKNLVRATEIVLSRGRK